MCKGGGSNQRHHVSSDAGPVRRAGPPAGKPAPHLCCRCRCCWYSTAGDGSSLDAGGSNTLLPAGVSAACMCSYATTGLLWAVPSSTPAGARLPCPVVLVALTHHFWPLLPAPGLLLLLLLPIACCWQSMLLPHRRCWHTLHILLPLLSPSFTLPSHPSQEVGAGMASSSEAAIAAAAVQQYERAAALKQQPQAGVLPPSPSLPTGRLG